MPKNMCLLPSNELLLKWLILMVASVVKKLAVIMVTLLCGRVLCKRALGLLLADVILIMDTPCMETLFGPCRDNSNEGTIGPMLLASCYALGLSF